MYYSTLSLLAACALAAPAPEAAPLKVPFSGLNRYEKRADGTVDAEAFFSMVNSTMRKYTNGERTLPTMSSLLSKRANSIPLTDQFTQGEDLLYYGPASVGANSPQTFTIDFDTGSADFFIPGPSCQKAQGCVGTTKYAQTGTPEGNSTSVTYGSGSVSGPNYFDTVSVAGLSATHTNVISLKQAQGFSTSASEGLMGMGFSTIANSKQPTFFENLMKQGKVAANEFSFYLGRGATGTGKNSELTLGGRDASKFTGTSSPVKVSKKGYWQVAVDGVTVNGRKAPLTAGQAAIDTGTTVILAPTIAATGIYSQILGAIPLPLVSGSPTETVFAFPCNTKSIPSFTFGGKSYAINKADFNFGQLTQGFADALGSGALKNALADLPIIGGGLCLGSIIGADLMPGQEFYVVGDSFLKNWYSTYSYDNGGSVSFAKSV